MMRQFSDICIWMEANWTNVIKPVATKELIPDSYSTVDFSVQCKLVVVSPECVLPSLWLVPACLPGAGARFCQWCDWHCDQTCSRGPGLCFQHSQCCERQKSSVLPPCSTPCAPTTLLSRPRWPAALLFLPTCWCTEDLVLTELQQLWRDVSWRTMLILSWEVRISILELSVHMS